MFYDLSHAIENGMTVYPGDPEPRIGRAPQEPPWTVSTLHLGSHTGTHMDAARHYYPDATTIDAYPVARFIVPALVIDVSGLDDDEADHVGDDRRAPPAGYRPAAAPCWRPAGTSISATRSALSRTPISRRRRPAAWPRPAWASWAPTP